MRPMLGLLLAFGLAAQPVQAAMPGTPTEVATLRQEGPAALDRLLALRGKPGVDQGRLRRMIDAVARQKDAHASGLYWHTDLEAAKTAARAQGKPILSLRLLGNLDESLSCANSRLFRTTLYANSRVSRYLRDRYVLHWRSVRPAARVTIDFGDGRTLTTTLTGNSLHYVLDPSGRPVDVLAGLYGAGRFLGVADVDGDEWRRRESGRGREHACRDQPTRVSRRHCFSVCPCLRQVRWCLQRLKSCRIPGRGLPGSGSPCPSARYGLA